MDETEKIPQKKYDSVAEFLLCAQIVGATFLQKAAIPLGGGTQVFLAIPLIFFLIALGMITGRIQIQKDFFFFYLLMVGGMCLSQLFGASDPSPLSLMLLVLIHASYIFTIKPNLTRPLFELEFFQRCMMLIALLGIFQYFLQFFLGPSIPYLLENKSLSHFIMQGFHGLNPVHYNSDIYKSNGFFMLEPAIFCQFLSIAILIEILYGKNWKRLLIYLVAVSVTFSGTGLIVLLLIVPFYLIQKRQFGLIAILALFVLSAGFWAPLLGFGHLIDRASEIMNPNSSGYARFISMFPFLRDNILPESDPLLFGRGAGSMPWDEGSLRQVDYQIFDPTWGKIFFEYGLVGVLFYTPFLIYCLTKPTKPSFLKWGLFIQFMFLGEYLLPPTVHGLIISLLLWPSVHDTIDPEKPVPDKSV